ncbi:MAG: cytochrome P450 [Caldilineaceae bacterium]
MTTTHRLGWREMQNFRHDQTNTVLQLTEQLGRLAHVNMLGVHMHLICEPDAIRELLIKHSDQLHRDPFTRRIFDRFVSGGVFMAEDEAWRRQRKLVQPVFHAAHIEQYAQTFVDYAQKMCATWQPGETRQLDQEMMALALRIICRTMFGADIDAVTARIGQLMQTIMAEAEAQLRAIMPAPKWLPTPGNVRQRRAVQEIQGLLMGIIQERKAKLALGDDGGNDLLARLLAARDEDGQPMSDQQVLDECLTVFVAGHETTAVALTWAWGLLLQHPAKLAKLKAEVLSALSDAPMSIAALEKMPYLNQVVKETLRLYPPAPGFGRTPTEPFSFNGAEYKPGDVLMFSIYALHRQKEFYPQPEEFRPERFGLDAEQPPRYAYAPFGAGPRTCVGNHFALLEIQMVLATMVQWLALSLAPNQKIEPVTLVTLRPQNGVRVCVGNA